LVFGYPTPPFHAALTNLLTAPPGEPPLEGLRFCGLWLVFTAARASEPIAIVSLALSFLDRDDGAKTDACSEASKT